MNVPPQERRRHLSSFHLELARLGEASPADRAFIDEHLRDCAECTEMAAAFEGWRREHASAGGAAARARAGERLRQTRRRRFAWWGTCLLVPVAAGLIIFVSVARHPTPLAGPEPDIGVKGGAGLVVAARRGDRVFPVRPGEPIHPGDQIRFVLERVRHPFVLIASVDGAGRANVYVPYEGSASLAVHASDRIEIPGSIIIDDSPGPERLFALISRRPLDAAGVRAALASIGRRGPAAIRGTSRLDVGADEQVSMLMEKVVP
jgi:hypothetical protein